MELERTQPAVVPIETWDICWNQNHRYTFSCDDSLPGSCMPEGSQCWVWLRSHLGTGGKVDDVCCWWRHGEWWYAWWVVLIKPNPTWALACFNLALVYILTESQVVWEAIPRMWLTHACSSILTKRLEWWAVEEWMDMVESTWLLPLAVVTHLWRIAATDRASISLLLWND